MIRLRRPSDDFLQRILHEQEHKPFSYAPIGATAGPDAAGTVPRGFNRDRFETDLGVDEDGRFERAGQALLEWVPQRGAGIRVFPDAAVAADRAFVLALPLPVGWAVAPARVAYLVDEADRFGYAYGTLPAHPEQGEEAFIVVRTGGRVRFEVIAVSRPRDTLARLGAPVARALQLRTISKYLRAMEATGA